LDINTQINFSFEINLKVDYIETGHVLLRAFLVPQISGSHPDFKREADGHLLVREDKIS
jgi:hypothetical protein